MQRGPSWIRQLRDYRVSIGPKAIRTSDRVTRSPRVQPRQPRLVGEERDSGGIAIDFAQADRLPFTDARKSKS